MKILFICLILFFYLPEKLHSQILNIEEIKFTHKDTKSFEDEILLAALGLMESDVYNPQILTENINQLRKFYFDNGFFDVKIDTALKYDRPEEEVFINIIIKENRHYRIDSLIYNGLNLLPDRLKRELSKNNKIKAGDFYSRADIVQQTNEIIDNLQNNGYMNATLKEDSATIVKKYETKSDTGLSITVNIVGADSIYYFGKTDITIIDNKYGVEKDLLRKEITYNEGDIYSKEKKLSSESGISKIPIVQSARIGNEEITGNKVDFNAEVILKDKTEIGPYARATVIDNTFYAGGGIQYINKYFLSGGKVLNLSLDALINSIDINRIEFSTSITQPHIFNKNSYLVDKITLGLYNIEDSKNYYIGNLLSYIQNFTDFTFYKNSSVDLTIELLRSNYSNFNVTDETIFNTFLSGTIIHDNTNKPFSPSRGFYHSLTLGNGGLFPKFIINTFEPNLFYSQYFKLFTSNNFYFDLANSPGKSVFAAKFLVGDIIEYGSGDRLVPLPSFYKFFSGGSSSVRGWGAQDNGVLSNTNDGGDFLIEGSFELRQRLFPGADDYKKNISGVLFLDYGNVWPADEDFRFDQIALAIGLGVRYNVLIGPVRVDLGFKLYDPSTGTNAWLINDFSNIFVDRFVVHFGIGEAF